MHLIHKVRSWTREPLVIYPCIGGIMGIMWVILFYKVLVALLERSPAVYSHFGIVPLWGACSALASLAGMSVVTLAICVVVDRGLGISKEWVRQSGGTGARNVVSGNFGYGCALSWTIIYSPFCFVFLIGYVIKVSFNPQGIFFIYDVVFVASFIALILGAVPSCFISRRVGVSEEWVRQRFLRTRECSKCKYPVISGERDVHGKRGVWLCTECGSRFGADGFRIKEALDQNSPQGA